MVNAMKFVLYPLATLIIIAMLSILNVGESYGIYGFTNETINMGTNFAGTIYYDSTETACCYANGTGVYAPGRITKIGSFYDAFWLNDTGYYPLYWSDGTPIAWADVGKADPALGGVSTSYTFDITSTLGLIALIIGFMAIAAVVGIKIVGSGIGENSSQIIMQFTMWLAIWGVFSAMALPFVMAMETLGTIVYFTLTLIYTLGLVMLTRGEG